MTDDLEAARQEIDDVDRQLVELLDRRAEVVQEIGEIKKQNDLTLHAPGREQEIFDRLETLSSGSFPLSSLKQIYREIIATSLNLEEPVTVAYLGPEATFTHAAARDRFGRSTEFKPVSSVSVVFDEVEGEQVDFGLVPVESSQEGAVRHTLDRFLDTSLTITSECFLSIDLQLLSIEEEIESVDTLLSHRQALSQANNWIDRNLASVTIEETPSTAQAAEQAANRSGTAAIASDVAAELYNLNTLARNLQGAGDNATRFLVLGRETPEPTGDDKTSVAFSVPNRAGALYESLRPFGDHGINMTKIESRPSPRRTWDYVFFVDFLGHRDETRVADLLESLRSRASYFKVLGSYPMAERSSTE